MSPWPALLKFHTSTSALLPYWQQYLGEAFTPFSQAFLEPDPPLVEIIECPRRCGCDHHIIPGQNGAFIARCICDPPTCPDIPVTAEDLTAYKPSWTKLTRAVSQALALDHKFVPFLQHYNTWQIGSWSPVAIPVFLTIRAGSQPFRFVAAELVARNHKPFILLTPTNHPFDNISDDLLHHARAAAFSLEATVDMHPDGSLHPLRPPADLFAQFSAPSSPTSSPVTRHPSLPSGPRFSIRRGRGVWHITFEYDPGEFLHEQGASFAAYLLLNPPPEPLHGLDLIGKIPGLYREQSALTHIADPETGKLITLEGHARIQERSLALDHKETMRGLRRRKDELEAILDSEDESEPVKAEAERELQAIYKYQDEHGGESKDSAQRAPRAIRRALNRFYEHQATALDAHGNPHTVLRAFAEHIRKYLLIPSARYCGPAGKRARGPLAGRFTYEPPPGVSWSP